MSELEVREDPSAWIQKKVFAEPAYSSTLYKILSFCETPRSLDEIEREIRSFPEMKTAIQSPRTCLSWLVQVNGIELLDPNNVDEKSAMWHTTPAGMRVVQHCSPGNRISNLLATEAAYAKVYVQLLQACTEPKTRSEIESLLGNNPALESPKVYPIYFIDAMERAGGIEWNARWQTTKAGKNFLNSEAQTSAQIHFSSSNGKE